MFLERNLASVNFFVIDAAGSLVPTSVTIDAILEDKAQLSALLVAIASLTDKIFLVDGFSVYEKSKSKKTNFLVKTSKLTLDYSIMNFVNIKCNQFTIEELSSELERVLNEKTGLSLHIKAHENLLLAATAVDRFRTGFATDEGLKSVCGAVELFADINSQERYDAIQLLATKIANSLNRFYINESTSYITTTDLCEFTAEQLKEEFLFDTILFNFDQRLKDLSIKSISLITSSSQGLIKLL